MLHLVLAAAVATSSPAAGEALAPLVVLDAGHGGAQPGAVGVCGTVEKDVALAVVLEMEKLLAASGRVRTVLTRRDDETMDLETRARIANTARAELFLSVHANASPGERSEGVETYFVSRAAANQRIELLAALENDGRVEAGDPPDTLGRILDSLRLQASHAESQRFAALVQESVSQRLAEPDRGVMQAPFFVLRQVDMASVLVEVGFLTNPAECLQLGDPTHQRKLAQALAAAVLAHVWTSGGFVVGAARP